MPNFNENAAEKELSRGVLGSAAGGLRSAQSQLCQAETEHKWATCIAVMATASDSAAHVPAGCKANQLALAI